jgi:hypothetical protein
VFEPLTKRPGVFSLTWQTSKFVVASLPSALAVSSPFILCGAIGCWLFYGDGSDELTWPVLCGLVLWGVAFILSLAASTLLGIRRGLGDSLPVLEILRQTFRAGLRVLLGFFVFLMCVMVFPLGLILGGTIYAAQIYDGALSSIIMGFGVLLYLACELLAFRLFLHTPILVYEEVGFLRSLPRVFELTRGHSWFIFWWYCLQSILMVPVLLLLFCLWAVLAALGVDPPSSEGAEEMLLLVGMLFVAPLAMPGLGLLYVTLRRLEAGKSWSPDVAAD